MRRRGFTLPEVLLTAGLALLLFGLLTMVLVPSLRVWLRAREDSEAQQAVAVVAARVREEVRSAHPESLVCLGSPPGLVLLSWRARDGAPAWNERGELQWQKHLVVYLRPEAREVRIQELPLAAPASDPEQVRLESFTPHPRDPVVAHGIRRLEVAPAAEPGALTVSVEAECGDRRSTLRTSAAPVLQPEPSPSP